MIFKEKECILFQGDSITDVGRFRDDPDNMGFCYPFLLKAQLMKAYPEKHLTIINKGISGNRIVDLFARWKEEGLNLKPSIISILIGVNDVWHEFAGGTGVDKEKFEKVYQMILAETKEKLPETKIVICEPFILPASATIDRWDDWSKEMAERRELICNLAEKNDCIFVPLQIIFDEAVKKATPSYWLGDGVHPTPAGHMLIAEQWLKVVQQQ